MDDVVGFPDDLDYKNTSSLGLILVNSLMNQIDGTIELYVMGRSLLYDSESWITVRGFNLEISRKSRHKITR